MLALALSLTLQTLVVDAGGGGDYASLDAAIAAAADGDVLLVQPGTYAGFSTDKALSILGPGSGPAPVIVGDCEVAEAAAFTLAGLEVEGTVLVRDVPGRLELDALSIAGVGFPLTITRCAQALVQRSTVAGDRHPYSLWSFVDPLAALRVEDSLLVAVQSTLTGGDGTLPDLDYAPGAHGLRALGSSVTLVGCDVIGGDGGVYLTLGIFCEPGGDGLRAEGSTVVLRGFENEVSGGAGSFNCDDGDSARLEGSALVHSGVELASGVVAIGGSQVVNPPNEPFLTLAGGDSPGATRRLLVHAKLDQVAVVIGALPAPPLALPGVEGPLWSDFAAPFFAAGVVATGIAAPVTIPFALPADLTGLEGLTLSFQAAFPGLPGTVDPSSFAVTNPVDAVLRF